MKQEGFTTQVNKRAPPHPPAKKPEFDRMVRTAQHIYGKSPGPRNTTINL